MTKFFGAKTLIICILQCVLAIMNFPQILLDM